MTRLLTYIVLCGLVVGCGKSDAGKSEAAQQEELSKPVIMGLAGIELGSIDSDSWRRRESFRNFSGPSKSTTPLTKRVIAIFYDTQSHWMDRASRCQHEENRKVIPALLKEKYSRAECREYPLGQQPISDDLKAILEVIHGPRSAGNWYVILELIDPTAKGRRIAFIEEKNKIKIDDEDPESNFEFEYTIQKIIAYDLEMLAESRKEAHQIELDKL